MVISDYLDSVSVNRATELLGVSRSGYYKWQQSSHMPVSEDNSDIDIPLREEIQNIAIEFPGYTEESR